MTLENSYPSPVESLGHGQKFIDQWSRRAFCYRARARRVDAACFVGGTVARRHEIYVVSDPNDVQRGAVGLLFDRAERPLCARPGPVAEPGVAVLYVTDEADRKLRSGRNNLLYDFHSSLAPRGLLPS